MVAIGVSNTISLVNNKTQAVVVGFAVAGSSVIGVMLIRGTRKEYDGWKETGSQESSWA
jgi:hypothetical protein